jgi:hypothetical protein
MGICASKSESNQPGSGNRHNNVTEHQRHDNRGRPLPDPHRSDGRHRAMSDVANSPRRGRHNDAEPVAEKSKTYSCNVFNIELLKNKLYLYNALNDIDIDEEDVFINGDKPIETIFKVRLNIFVYVDYILYSRAYPLKLLSINVTNNLK